MSNGNKYSLSASCPAPSNPISPFKLLKYNCSEGLSLNSDMVFFCCATHLEITSPRPLRTDKIRLCHASFSRSSCETASCHAINIVITPISDPMITIIVVLFCILIPADFDIIFALFINLFLFLTDK